MLWLLLACNDNLLVQKGVGQEGEVPAECWDGLDNDDDGYIDCDDQDCLIYVECTGGEDTGVDTDDPVDTGDVDTDDTEETDTQDTEETDTDTQTDPNDQDGDGFTPSEGDCDDLDANTNPNGNDPTVDGKDQNCDGVDGPDMDSDGYVDSNAGGTDCNDGDASVNPGATDVPGDGIDQDCDGADATSANQDDFTNDGEHTFTVPAGVYSLTASMWGGGGAGGEQLLALGGGAGFVEVVFPVTPGETLTVYVAEGGTYTGAGGGASAIYRGSSLIAIAGGGGGGASDGNSGDSWAGGAGGAGGATAEDGMNLLYHQTGLSYSYCTAATGGTGATQSSPGIGGIPSGDAEYQGVSRLCYGADGGPLEGGGATGDSSQCNFTGAYLWESFSSGSGANGHPGSGGAGYYGGGGGGSVYTYCGAGGGGGSSWAFSGAAAVSYLDGSGQIQGNEALSNGAGRGGERDYGGASDNGADGRILFTW